MATRTLYLISEAGISAMSLQPTMLIVKARLVLNHRIPERSDRKAAWLVRVDVDGLADFASERSITQEGNGVAIAALTDVTYVGQCANPAARRLRRKQPFRTARRRAVINVVPKR